MQESDSPMCGINWVSYTPKVEENGIRQIILSVNSRAWCDENIGIFSERGIYLA